MILRAVLLVGLLALPAVAQELPAPLSDTVSDFAGVLPAEDEARIARQLDQIRAETGVQMVVVTMDRTETYGGAGSRIDAYAKALFNAWGVGDAGRNDGILFLVAVEDRVTRIALGSAYDAVYDGRAARVLDTAVLPALREGRIADGVSAGVESARYRLITPFLAGKPVTVAEGFPESGAGTTLWAAGLAALAAVFVFGGRAVWRSRKRCPKCGEPTLVRQNEVLTAATRHMTGNGIRHMSCRSCGFVDRERYLIPAVSDRDENGDDDRSSGGSSGGGSSSGGFGGGSSSGGGATGKW